MIRGSDVYDRLPEFLQPMAKRGYYRIRDEKPNKQHRAEFVEAFCDSRSEYDEYVSEFESGRVREIWQEGLEQFRRLTGMDTPGVIGIDAAREYYVVARKLQPTTVVETGVCNGLSTLSLLLALDRNGSGTLHSIDYPFRADESLAEFRAETYDGYGGAAIPSDTDPGWIVPDRLRDRWELTIGKSQRELPRVLADVGEVDLFSRDSEHSVPCMLFEFELAYEWLTDDGMILTDDITYNEAFSTFIDVRQPEWGKLSQNVGYIRKRGGESDDG